MTTINNNTNIDQSFVNDTSDLPITPASTSTPTSTSTPASASSSSLIVIDQSLVNNTSDWPITINEGVTVTFSENLTFNLVNHYFVIGGSNVTIDGAGKMINIDNIINYPGLLQNGTHATKGYKNIMIKNICVSPNGSTLLDNSSWICQEYFGNGS
jgi:hypothetical protein